MSKKKILLVGGSGFIGHNLAIYLKNRGHQPYVVDSLSVNNLLSYTNEEVKNKILYKAILNNRLDLLDKEQIKISVQDSRDNQAIWKLYEEINPDIVIHLAAVSHANKSNKDPHSTFDHSLRTLENTLDFCKTTKIHVIYLSSSMVYGNFNSKDVDENTTCKPMGIYGTLKYSGELIVKAYNQVFDLPYTIVRPSALYGERCVSRRVGQIFIENALQGMNIEINGDGNERLDFTYIEDFIQGISLACESPNSINETFNITFGNSRKINELTTIIQKEFKNIEIIYKEKEKLMPERGTLNVDKAKKLLNYKPEYPLEIGYEKYIKWYKNFWQSIK
jgi:nucleoside-diphosphate-sugar epimerase